MNEAERADAVAQLTRAFGVPHRRDAPRLAAALESVEREDVRYEGGVVAAWRVGAGPAVLRAGFDLREELPRLDVELLVVHSRDDERMPFADSEEIVPRVGRGTLLAVDGLTHRRTARDPEVVARIAQFVSP